MKILFFVISFFYITVFFCQNTNGDNGPGLVGLGNMSQFNGGNIFFNKPTDLKGDIHVFPNWKNIGIIDIDNKMYRLANINFNIKTNNFESQVGKDSIFILDIANVNHIHINNRKFQSFYFSNKKGDQSFEILYDGDDFKLLKGYEVGIRYGETDPLMVKKKVDTYFTTKTYYVRRGADIQEVSLKKKNILLLFKDKANLVGTFAKKNKISYKKDNDLKKLFNYFNSL